MDLTHKTALVTGGTHGIGAATAVELAAAGANLVVVARDVGTDHAQTIKVRVEELGRRCVLVAGDMGDREACTNVVERCGNEFGSLDILVHCAGGLVRGGIFEIDSGEWYRGFDVHVHAVFWLMRAAQHLIRSDGGGAVVLVSSVAGVRGLKNHIGYQTVKGALVQLTRALSFELADYNVRVNCVAPGIIRTRFHDGMSPETKKFNEDNRIPLHREGRPEEVASVIRELVSNEYITGQTVVIDGGLTMRIA